MVGYNDCSLVNYFIFLDLIAQVVPRHQEEEEGVVVVVEELRLLNLNTICNSSNSCKRNRRLPHRKGRVTELGVC